MQYSVLFYDRGITILFSFYVLSLVLALIYFLLYSRNSRSLKKEKRNRLLSFYSEKIEKLQKLILNRPTAIPFNSLMEITELYVV